MKKCSTCKTAISNDMTWCWPCYEAMYAGDIVPNMYCKVCYSGRRSQKHDTTCPSLVKKTVNGETTKTPAGLVLTWREYRWEAKIGAITVSLVTAGKRP